MLNGPGTSNRVQQAGKCQVAIILLTCAGLPPSAADSAEDTVRSASRAAAAEAVPAGAPSAPAQRKAVQVSNNDRILHPQDNP
jgi:hypothetical protein